jgi:hypothetical protein
MKKTLKKLVLDRETIKPLQPEDLSSVNGGEAVAGAIMTVLPGPGPSVGLVCSNCTPPFNPRPTPSLPRPNPLSLPQDRFPRR